MLKNKGFTKAIKKVGLNSNKTNMDFDNELDETLADADGASDDEEETPGISEGADGEKEEEDESLAADEEE